MRLEQINENQIRCFLTREEMEIRHLHLKELAYGTEKAKRLFRELMEEAYKRFGFEAQNMPVMVEAVPLHDNSLVLVITRVENPEELDTRYSSFAPSVKSGPDDADLPASSALSQLLDSIRRQAADGQGQDPEEEKDAGACAAQPQLFTFHSLGRASDAACMAAPSFRGASALYRDPADAKYYLFLSSEEGTGTPDLSASLSVFSEFGTPEYITPAREQYLLEHCEVLCAESAVQKLAALADK